MSDCDSVLETHSIASVLSDNSSDEILNTFDELITSSERLVDSIKESTEKLKIIHGRISSNNIITVTHNGWSGDFDELLEILRLKASENHDIHFGDMLLDILETAKIHTN